MTKATSDIYDEYPDTARVIAPGLRHYGRRRQFSGRATTVKCFEDNSRIRELAATPGAGRVMIVDGGGSLRCALVGDVIAGEAQRNGWEGIVVFGCVRDRAAMRELDLGVMALAVTPRKSTRRGEGQVGVAIEVAGVLCRPDDRVHADEDGVLLLEPETASG